MNRIGKGEGFHDSLTNGQTTDRLNVVLSTAVDGIIIIDDRGMIDSFNPACERMFGYAAAEVMGHNVNVLMPTPYHEEHDRYLTNYLDTGERKIIGIGREVAAKRKDGTVFPIELSVGEAFHEGKRIFVGIIRDISERKAAENELREGEERLKAVIETAVDGVIIIDASAKIQIFNPACEKLFGYKAEEIIGKNVKTLMPEPYRGEHDTYMSNYRETGVRKIIGIGREVMGQRKNGTTFPMELSVGEARQDDVPVFVGIIRDITERKAAEQAIKRSVDELAAFAYSVAHDLKAPLRAIEGFSSALNEDYREKLDGDAIEYLDHIAEGATRMGAMIDDLLDYSRVGRDELSFSMISPRDGLERTIRSLSRTIADKEAEVSIEGEWCEIEAHLPSLQSVFQNLITNALKFNKPDTPPRLTITGAPSAHHLAIEFKDNGIGIPPDCYDKIFQIFHRLHDRSEYPGTGIGLAVVRKGVDFHNGHVAIESNPADGTTFRITLPKYQPDRH